jgi:ABC-type glycerol-3-phosphate transport system substrate-binding protein
MRKIVIAVAIIAITAALVGKIYAADKRKVTVWSFAPNNVEEYVKRKADIESKFNIELDVQVVAQNAFVQKLQAVLMDGKGAPDIIEWMIENNRILNADPKKSFVIPLDSYVAKSDVFAKVPSGRVAWVKYGGHTYGLPHDVHPVILIYNDTIWKSVGVDLETIKTWDEFFEASKKLTAEKKEGKPVHFALPYGNDGLNNTMFMIWQQTGTQVLDAKGKPTFTTPEFKAFVQKWFDWQKTGAFTAWDWGNFPALLANGTLCSYTSPDWWVPQVNLASTGSTEGAISALGSKKEKRAEVKYKFKVRALPVYKAGGAVTASWGGSFMAIPKGTKGADAIYKIMEYIEYDLSASKVRWESTGMLPPIGAVWSDPMFSKPDDRFGGQKLGELMVSQAKVMPKVNSGDIFWDALGDFSQQYSEMISNKVTIDAGLAATQKKAQYRFDQIK